METRFSVIFVLLLLFITATVSHTIDNETPSLRSIAASKIRSMIMKRTITLDVLKSTLPDDVVFDIFKDKEWTSTHLLTLMKEEQLYCKPEHDSVMDDRENQSLASFIFSHITTVRMDDFQSFKSLLPCLKNLQELDLTESMLGDEEVTVMANATDLLQNLQRLNLEYNSIGLDGVKAIALNMPQLTHLNLNNNYIGSLGAIEIASRLHELVDLKLALNRIGDVGAISIASNMHQLQDLNVFGNDMGPTGAVEIATRMKNLVELDIGNNDILDEGAIAIAFNMTKLRKLSIRGTNRISKFGVRAIVTQLSHQLTHLNLACCNFNDTTAFSYAPQMVELDLTFNHIDPAGAIEIASKMKNLQCLKLDYNHIGDEGIIAIANKTSFLKELTISSNNVTMAGVVAIASKLKNLRHLDLGSNKIGDAGATEIASGLPYLTHLEMPHTDLGNLGVTEIAMKMKQLRHLNLSRNNISQGAIALYTHLNVDQLTYLNLDFNNLSAKLVRKLQDRMQQVKNFILQPSFE